MSSGETVAIRLPTLSPGRTARNELGFGACVPPLAADPAWAWLLTPEATDYAFAAAVVVSLDEDAAGALFPPT